MNCVLRSPGPTPGAVVSRRVLEGRALDLLAGIPFALATFLQTEFGRSEDWTDSRPFPPRSHTSPWHLVPISGEAVAHAQDPDSPDTPSCSATPTGAAEPRGGGRRDHPPRRRCAAVLGGAGRDHVP